MDKFLKRKKFGVCAAFFALLIQFVAPFGHIHLNRFGFQPVAVVSAQEARTDGAVKPLGGDSDKRSADICDVCATLNLIASGQVVSPPALPIQFAYFAAKMPIPAAPVPVGLRHVDFRSRAPPFA